MSGRVREAIHEHANAWGSRATVGVLDRRTTAATVLYAAIDSLVAAARAEERERCAVICEKRAEVERLREQRDSLLALLNATNLFDEAASQEEATAHAATLKAALDRVNACNAFGLERKSG